MRGRGAFREGLTALIVGSREQGARWRKLRDEAHCPARRPAPPPPLRPLPPRLAVIVTALVWAWRAPLYPATATLPRRAAGAAPDPLPRRAVALVLGVLVIAFVGVAGT